MPRACTYRVTLAVDFTVDADADLGLHGAVRLAIAKLSPVVAGVTVFPAVGSGDHRVKAEIAACSEVREVRPGE